MVFVFDRLNPSIHTLFQMYTNYIREKLAEVANQPAESHGSESARIHSKGPGVSHVIARSGADAHDQRHTNQVMYSCGSLAPKLQKGKFTFVSFCISYPVCLYGLWN